MKKLIYIVLVITVVTACSEPTQTNVDDTLPKYDMISHCNAQTEHFKRADIKGIYNHSGIMFNYCIKEEKANYEWLVAHWDLLSSKLKVFCKEAINPNTGSYRALKGCSFAAICFEDHKGLKICEEREKPAWE